MKPILRTGLDPELLTICGKHIIPAAQYLSAPQPTSSGVMNRLSYDNAAAEFRPKESAFTKDLTDRLKFLLQAGQMRLLSAIRRGTVQEGSTWTLAPAGKLLDRDRVLSSVSTFGCSPPLTVLPDFSQTTTAPFMNAPSTPIRSAGFHVHQELLSGTATPVQVVCVLDGLLGLLDVLMNKDLGFLTESRMRRQILGYGRAGEYRVRPAVIGTILEYRTLSPWPFMSPQMVAWVVGVVRRVAERPADWLYELLAMYPARGEIVQAINTADVLAAVELHTLCLDAWTNLTGKSNADKTIAGQGYVPPPPRRESTGATTGICMDMLADDPDGNDHSTNTEEGAAVGRDSDSTLGRVAHDSFLIAWH